MAKPMCSFPQEFNSAATPSKEVVGEGGCSAHALHSIRVFTSFGEAVLKLDKVQERFPSLSDKLLPKSWTLAIVATAVKESRHHWKKLAIHPDSDKCVRLREILQQGSYFIYGRINRVFFNKEKKIENWKEFEEDETSSDLHSCAVIDNRLFETSIDGIKKTFNADVLWIDDDKSGKINDKGYMRQIRAVYQVYRCTGDDNCTGKCGPQGRLRMSNNKHKCPT